MGGSGAGEAAGDEVECFLLGVVGADVFVNGDFGEEFRVNGAPSGDSEAARLFVDVAVVHGFDAFGIIFGDCVGEAPNAAEEFAVSEHCCRSFR
ncbi:hypothetical protein AWQ23_14855 (plasmid) [Picosynechococcus sp. PCC 73109]|nr:hypothetical protein AWQ23_14855 [Picosynechococcus sp. PCC 73109]